PESNGIELTVRNELRDGNRKSHVLTSCFAAVKSEAGAPYEEPLERRPACRCSSYWPIMPPTRWQFCPRRKRLQPPPGCAYNRAAERDQAQTPLSGSELC